MKTMLLISVLFAISIAIPVSSFAEEPIVCTFADETTSLDNLFEKDFAVKAFVEKHHDATKSMPTDAFGSAKNHLVLQAQKDNTEERLEIRFHTDANGCHIPASYHYSYDDGAIDVTVRNSVASFTEIMNLIESDDLGIEDFYPDDCTFVDLDVAMSNGKSYGICKEGSAVTILIDAADDGSLQVDLPIDMVYSLPSSDCVPTWDFFVMMDKKETHYEITPTETGNLVKVEFPEGVHKITISGSFIIPNPSPAQYCGIVEGYLDKKYLAPLDQTDHGVASKSIRCNDGLTLVQKYDATPACVTPETLARLVERGWVIKDFGNAHAEPAIPSGLQVDVTGQQQIRRETTHDIAVDVTRDGYVVSNALVRITIEDYGKNVIRDFKGRTDNSGRFVFSWEIPKSFDDIKTLLAYVDVTDDISAKTILFKFQVYCLPGETGCKVEGN